MIGSSVAYSDGEAIVTRLLALGRNRRLTDEETSTLAEQALACGREEEAVALLRPIAARHTAPALLLHWIGLLLRAIDQHDEALAAFERAAGAAPNEPVIAHARARVALEAGLPAVALFERARRLAPSDGPVLLGRAAALLAANEPGQALADLDALLVQHPGWYPGHETAVQLRWMHGDREGFTRSIEQALKGAPRDPALWRLLLDSLMHAQQHERVLVEAERARGVIGDQPAILVHEASAASAVGEHGRADRLFASLALDNDPLLVVHHVRHLLRTGRPDEAVVRAERVVEGLGGEHVWPYLALAWRLLDDPRYTWLLGDPTLIGIYDLTDELGDMAWLGDRLRGLHRATHQHLDQSVRGGTQTDGPLFSRLEPEIRQLREAIARRVVDHIRQLPERDARHPVLRHRRDRPVRFSGSWSVRLTAAGHHANHVHPAGWFSSAFYIALPSEADRPPPAGWLTLGAPPADLGLALPPERLVEPRPGQLVLFPSIMWHGTKPFGRGERLTAACDIALPAR